VKEGDLLDKSKPTLCLCKAGVRSMKVASFLVQAGFQEVYNIDGGINEYSREVDPSVPMY
jgi:rhodanese-related sulfurtransferase